MEQLEICTPFSITAGTRRQPVLEASFQDSLMRFGRRCNLLINKLPMKHKRNKALGVQLWLLTQAQPASVRCEYGTNTDSPRAACSLSELPQRPDLPPARSLHTQTDRA